MRARCPLCHTELNVPDVINKGFLCRCGAYGEITLLSNANLFPGKAKKALGLDPSEPRPIVEIIDGGIVLEEKGEPAILLWAKKPKASRP
jgi:hypothetical protein